MYIPETGCSKRGLTNKYVSHCMIFNGLGRVSSEYKIDRVGIRAELNVSAN